MRQFNLYLFFSFIAIQTQAQLLIGNSNTEINFREGPGTNYSIKHTVDKSNMLVILPREPQNGFVEVFDVETSSRGYVYETLIIATDTLNYQNQHFFEKSGSNTTNGVELIIINRTNRVLYFWINKMDFDIQPREKRTLVFDEEDILYFSSAPGLYPIFGKEVLKKGESYIWNFSQ